jgi:hypothetical protein
MPDLTLGSSVDIPTLLGSLKMTHRFHPCPAVQHDFRNQKNEVQEIADQ